MTLGRGRIRYELAVCLLATSGSLAAVSFVHLHSPQFPGALRGSFVVGADGVVVLLWRHYIFHRLIPSVLLPQHRVFFTLYRFLSWTVVAPGLCFIKIQQCFPRTQLQRQTGDPMFWNVACSICFCFTMVLLLNFVLFDCVTVVLATLVSLAQNWRSRKQTSWSPSLHHRRTAPSSKPKVAKQTTVHEPSSRLQTVRATICTLLTVLTVFRGFQIAREDPIVNRVTVQISHLPAAIDGFQILHLSDLHIGISVGKSRMERTVRRANQACADSACDLVVLTGDAVDGHPEYMSLALEPLRALGGIAPPPKLFVTGNHDHMHGQVDKVMDALAGLGFEVLTNGSIRLPKGNASLDQLVVAGVYDLSSSRITPEYEPSVPIALNNAIPGEDTIIVLAHQPNHFQEVSRYGVDLVLSGHTHSGQVFPMTIGAWFGNQRFAGYYPRSATEGTASYVSAGTHWWGPPVRFTTHHHEIVHITLTR
jgi:predicted MPP superfamily phosphohydrolase